MKSILVSIRPQWVAKILNGEKTLEIRKTAPKDLPCEVWIYCTKSGKNMLLKTKGSGEVFFDNVYNPYVEDNLKGKIVAKFVLRKVHTIYNGWTYKTCCVEYGTTEFSDKEFEKRSCVSKLQLDDYLKKNRGYAWEISDLQIFNKPRELREFHYPCPHHDFKDCLDDCYKALKEKKIKPPHCHYGTSFDKAPQSWCYVEG